MSVGTIRHAEGEIPKPYLIRNADSNKDLEDFINANSLLYRAISISDTNSYITVLLERRDLR